MANTQRDGVAGEVDLEGIHNVMRNHGGKDITAIWHRSFSVEVREASGALNMVRIILDHGAKLVETTVSESGEITHLIRTQKGGEEE